VTSAATEYTTRLLSPDTWDDFAALVEANNGVWGGCWCIGFHPEGIGKGSTVVGNREAKLTHVNNGTIRQMLVYRDGRCVGWCQFGPPAEVASIKNPKAYEKGLRRLGRGLPRAGCWTRSATWRLPAYRAREPVRRVRIRARPSHRQVALGHASAYLRLEVSHRTGLRHQRREVSEPRIQAGCYRGRGTRRWRRAALVGFVVVQADEQTGVRLGEHFREPGLLPGVMRKRPRPPFGLEELLVPVHAGVEVCDGQADVVYPGNNRAA
jgi:hypothetical protein